MANLIWNIAALLLAGLLVDAGEIHWRVKVKTSSSFLAGTDGDVLIKLIGDSESSFINLDSPDKNDFETGNLDTFNIKTPDIGDLRRIKVKYADNDDWKLSWIKVENLVTEVSEYMFSYHKWLTHKKVIDLRPQPGSGLPSGCKRSADIQFLLDSSRSVGRQDFKKLLGFVRNFVNTLNIAPDGDRVGVTSFSNTVKNAFFLKDYDNKKAVQHAIKKVAYLAGETMTEKALKFVREQSFAPTNGARPNSKNILVVITDGHATHADLLQKEVNLIHQENIAVFTIGIGQMIDPAELKLIASDDSNVFQTADFDTLVDVIYGLKKATCKETESSPTKVSCASNPCGVHKCTSRGGSYQCTCNKGFTKKAGEQCVDIDECSNQDQCGIHECSNTPGSYQCTCNSGYTKSAGKCVDINECQTSKPCEIHKCTNTEGGFTCKCNDGFEMKNGKCTAKLPPKCQNKPADIHFLIDASGSVQQKGFTESMAFVTNFVNSFTIGQNDVKVGLTTYTETPENRFYMNKYTNAEDLLVAISELKYVPYGYTYTPQALEFVRQKAFTAAHGGRDDVVDILIVMTDGITTPEAASKFLPEVKLLKQTSFKRFALGVGDGANRKELDAIASSPSHVYMVSDMASLQGIIQALQIKTCDDL